MAHLREAKAVHGTSALEPLSARWCKHGALRLPFRQAEAAAGLAAAAEERGEEAPCLRFGRSTPFRDPMLGIGCTIHFGLF